MACSRPDHTGRMANQAKIVVTVTAQRGASTINFSTKGRYISLPTNGITANLPRQPIQSTASALAFWQSVLTIVQAELPAAASA